MSVGDVRTRVLAICGFFFLILGLVALRSTPGAPPTTMQGAQVAPESNRHSAPIAPPPAATRVHPLAVEAKARTPVQWIELKAALIADPGSVLPRLLDQYACEDDPALKGLLAVLLATDPSTHARILEDYHSKGPGEWELFQGLALFALLAREKDASFWSNLVKMVEVAPRQLKLDRGLRREPLDAETTMLFNEIYNVRSTTIGDTMFTTYTHPVLESRAADAVEASDEPEVRAALLEAHDRPWDWRWIHSVTYRALWMTARADLEFAGALFERFTATGERSRVVAGLDLLSNEVLPARHVPTVAAIARTALDDPELFSHAVRVLGHQKGGEPEAMLLDLHSMARSRDDVKHEVLRAMEEHGSIAYEPVARAELGSALMNVRMQALELLAKVAAPTSAEAIVQALISDPEPDVRHKALYLLVQANRWTPLEEDALTRIALTDPHRPLRNLATRLRAAQDRTSDDAWNDSDLEPADLLSDLK